MAGSSPAQHRTIPHSAARPYELPGTQPGASAVDNIPWEQPLAQGTRSGNGIVIIVPDMPDFKPNS